MNRVLFSLMSSAALACALVACGSNVKLDDVPVENRTATAVSQSGADSSGAAGRNVEPVKLNDGR